MIHESANPSDLGFHTELRSLEGVSFAGKPVESGQYLLEERPFTRGSRVAKTSFHRVYDLKTKTWYAAKRIPKDSELYTQQMIRQELCANITQESVHTISTHGICVDRHGATYLIMDLIEPSKFCDLEEKIQTKGSLPSFQIVAITKVLGQYIDQNHRHGLFHKDLHPKNILVPREDATTDTISSWADQIKIIDFGLMLYHMPKLSDGISILGTIGYLSPQRLKTMNSDILQETYALCRVIEAMLAGFYLDWWDEETLYRQTKNSSGPFSGFFSILESVYPDRETRRNIDRFLMRGLNKDESLRWQSGLETSLELYFALQSSVPKRS